MTNTKGERLEIIDELLVDAGFPDGCEMRQTLFSLGSLASLPTPAPRPELASMLAGTTDELAKRRWRPKHRTAVVGVAVIAAMGLGAGGVAAASSGFPRDPSFVEKLLGRLVPHSTSEVPALPLHDEPKISTEPAPTVHPATVPAVPTLPANPTTQTGPAAVGGTTPPAAQPHMSSKPGAVADPSKPQAPPAPVGRAAQSALEPSAQELKAMLVPKPLPISKPDLLKTVLTPERVGREGLQTPGATIAGTTRR
ncbi:hypothetical protein [Arthrobacter sp. efr-133-TYG-104]|uniref:hypothetical protein n=1 Tax=Arthrobacter sp. efr-133-TYG-104 TaxID=3040324 RepID=UPI00254A67C9|nr:hypothetical protein [Arthrobacter sp. efr-133-TYG-104]